jgi:hypothetical protein
MGCFRPQLCVSSICSHFVSGLKYICVIRSQPEDHSPRCEPQILWGEIAPCDHLLQIYQDDAAFLDALEGFVAGGIKAYETVIVIATPLHLAALEARLGTQGISLSIARARQQYLTRDAEETLARFMVNGWPNEILFQQMVGELLAQARRDGRRVRAFGEMVALLWGRGLTGATVRLEQLWNTLCQKERFSLFCAYPRSGFAQDAELSIKEICSAHSRRIADQRAA